MGCKVRVEHQSIKHFVSRCKISTYGPLPRPKTGTGFPGCFCAGFRYRFRLLLWTAELPYSLGENTRRTTCLQAVAWNNCGPLLCLLPCDRQHRHDVFFTELQLANGQPGAPKGARGPRGHTCTDTCRHTCGEMGGRTKKQKACPRPGGWGRTDVRQGSATLCCDHDPLYVTEKRRRKEAAGQDTLFPELGLSPLETSFVLEYAGRCNSNATRAYALASTGNEPTADNRASCQASGSLMLRRDQVRKALSRLWEERAAPTEELIARITADARLSIAGLVHRGDPQKQEDANALYLKLTPEALEEYGTLIREIEVDETSGRVLRVKLNDSAAARRDLAKILRLFAPEGNQINIYAWQGAPDEEIRRRLELARQRMAGPTAPAGSPPAASAGPFVLVEGYRSGPGAPPASANGEHGTNGGKKR